MRFFGGSTILKMSSLNKKNLFHTLKRDWACLPPTRVSFETSFDSKQPKLEAKLVSALSETKRFFLLFRFYTETASFGVSIEPKQKDHPKQTETYRNESNVKSI